MLALIADEVYHNTARAKHVHCGVIFIELNRSFRFWI